MIPFAKFRKQHRELCLFKQRVTATALTILTMFKHRLSRKAAFTDSRVRPLVINGARDLLSKTTLIETMNRPTVRNSGTA